MKFSQKLIHTLDLEVNSNIPIFLCGPGKGQTSMNAHCGPVDFLLSVSGSVPLNLPRLQDSSPNGCSATKCPADAGDGHQGVPPSGPDSEVEEKPVQLLQYRLCSTQHLPGRPLTAQPAPPAPPTGSPEHSPEDGSIYELSEDPDVWVRGRRAAGGAGGTDGEARRNTVTSTAVFSGGRGRRHLQEAESDCAENTLLVWQLPLTFSQ